VSDRPIRNVAIIGSGPSGLYAATALMRARPDLTLDIFERLPTPFGLVRSGVAPDHAGTKAVTRQFEKLMEHPNVSFLGNVEIGRDVGIADLRQAYDLVFIATGASVDRKLGIRGEELTGVYGSAAFTGWYNGHPDWSALSPFIGPRVAIIGMGNVALDIARILARSAKELASTDISGDALKILGAGRAHHITLVARRGPRRATFTAAELTALAALPEVSVNLLTPVPEDTGDQAVDRRLAALRAANAAGGPVSVHLTFDRTPIAFEGNGCVQAVVWRDRDGEERRESFDTVVTAIGYQSAVIQGVPMAGGAAECDENGRILPSLYALGWFRRGPSGTIPTGRQEAQATVRLALDQQPNGTGGNRDGLVHALRSRREAIVDWRGWKRIDSLEQPTPAPRTKLLTWNDLLRAAAVCPPT